MLLHADDYMADFIEILDLNSGEYIRRCLWANQETGEYAVYKLDNDETIISDGKLEYYRSNIVFIYKPKNIEEK